MKSLITLAFAAAILLAGPACTKKEEPTSPQGTTQVSMPETPPAEAAPATATSPDQTAPTPATATAPTNEEPTEETE